MEDNSKKPWQSKSLWLALIVAVSAFVPQVHAVIVANPEVFSGIVGALFAGLRLITSGKISIS